MKYVFILNMSIVFNDTLILESVQRYCILTLARIVNTLISGIASGGEDQYLDF